MTEDVAEHRALIIAGTGIAGLTAAIYGDGQTSTRWYSKGTNRAVVSPSRPTWRTTRGSQRESAVPTW